MSDPGSAGIQLSWVLASSQPERIALFYARLLGLTPQPGASSAHWLVITAKGERLQFYRPSSQRPQQAQGRAWSPCFTMATEMAPMQRLDRWCRDALDQGASLHEAARMEPFGAECWMKDPDQNDFLLLVTPSLH